MNYPSTREEAKRTGASHYFTGKPCKRGHIAIRKTKGCCIECLKEDWRTDNERRKQLPKSEASKASGRRYYEKNKELVLARAKAQPKEVVTGYKRRHKKNNPELYKMLTNARRKRNRLATPKWLTREQLDAIKQVYAEALKLKSLTGVAYAVDHIIPILGDNVCGLHVPWNLQVITQEENLRKSNKVID